MEFLMVVGTSWNILEHLGTKEWISSCGTASGISGLVFSLGSSGFGMAKAATCRKWRVVYLHAS